MNLKTDTVYCKIAYISTSYFSRANFYKAKYWNIEMFFSS